MKRIPYIAPSIPKNLLATALDAVIVSDADGRIVEWNQHTTTTLSRPLTVQRAVFRYHSRLGCKQGLIACLTKAPTMTKSIFVNLPVTNLPASESFYEVAGFQKNQAFSDETACCMVWSDSISVMLLTHKKWAAHTDRPLCPPTHSEVMLALPMEDKEAVDAMLDAAQAHGGKADVNPKQDHGFMYGRSFADPDGHIWEVMWMDAATMTAAN